MFRLVDPCTTDSDTIGIPLFGSTNSYKKNYVKIYTDKI